MLRTLHCTIALIAVGSFAFVPSSWNRTLAETPTENLVEANKVADVVPLKDLDGHFPFQPPASIDAWKERAEVVRKQVLVSLGLWPKPTMAPLQPVIHSPRQMDGYSVSKVYFESLPGLFVTGSLFLPQGSEAEKSGRRYPAVLCPHGHWINGRFYQAPDNEIAQLLATGAERFESAARNHMQARCIQLARMGCIVFQYDMLGYADSQQMDHNRSHLFGMKGPNPDLGADQWLLYSATAEGHFQSTMALQTINSLQAFEFLANRKDVDATKIAITGASGGGTQSFVAAAVEPRIACAFPAVMVSTGMQGGCTCENASSLRVGTGNIELAALIAPRPMGLTAADDWTRTMPQDGFPELQKIYELFGVKDRVRLFPAVHFPHNFNHVSRVALYGFINQSFGLGFKEPILEKDFEVLGPNALTVWDQEHPAPSSGVNWEAKLLANWKADVAQQIKNKPEISVEGWSTILEPANTIAKSLSVTKSTTDSGDTRYQVRNSVNTVVGELLVAKSIGTEPIKRIQLMMEPDADVSTTNGAAVMWVRDANGFPSATEQPRVKNPRPAASYTYGYNAPQAIRKVAVLVRVLDELNAQSEGTKVALDGKEESGFLASAVKRLRPKTATVLEGNDPFDFGKIGSVYDPMFIPGALRYGPLR